MEMHQVRYFLAVCRTLNFTKAAEECNVAQPSLTRAIQKLEEEFGGLLFHRERANTHLTELGRAMQPHLERTYEAAQSAKQLAVGFKKGEIAPLRLGVVNSVAGRVLTDVLARVREGVPSLELSMGSGPQGEVLEEALEGDFDLVVLGHDTDLPERVRSWTLFRENFRLVMPVSHRLASVDTVKVSDLAGEALVERAQCFACSQLRQLCDAAGVVLEHAHNAAREDQVQSMVRSGLGLALVPLSVPIEAGLAAKHIDGFDVQRVVTLGAVAGRRFSAASDAFVKLARARDWSDASQT